MLSEISERVSTSYDIVGHPQQESKPVEEGRHYKVLAYTDWADSFIPTMIKWNHGEVDSFTDPEKSRKNQRRALQEELEAEGQMKCKEIGEPCDPESYHCRLLEHTSKRVQNKVCERIVPAVEAEC